MNSVKDLKKLTWYDPGTAPPGRTQRLGSLQLLILVDDRVQEGAYSHEENQFYAYQLRYSPQTGGPNLTTTLQSINDALQWEKVPCDEIQKWMLIEK